MDKIATPKDLVSELQRLIAYASSEKPSRAKLSSALFGLADKVSMDHPNGPAMKKYLREHPDADPKNHRVKKNDRPEGGNSLDFLKKRSKMPELIQGMGAEARKSGLQFGVNDAVEAVRLWFDGGSESKEPKQVAAQKFLTSPAGKKLLSHITNGVSEALKKDGGVVGFQDVGKTILKYMKGE
jgi:hypothetical protein